MRDVKTILGIITLIASSLAMAADLEIMDERPDLTAEALQQPPAVKQIFREAWNLDNGTDLTVVDQLEYFYNNNPGFDEDTLILLNRGTQLLKLMNTGTKGIDPEPIANTIREEPFLSMVALSGSMDSDAKATDVLSLGDTIEPAERLGEKLFQKKELGEKRIPIDIEQF